MTPAQWSEVVETNLTGVFNACHAAIPTCAGGAAAIVNISSLAGKSAFPGGAAYCATKSGVNAFSEALMQEGPLRQHPSELRDAWFGGDWIHGW
jgi:NADP-dependent 3-hydroxy acid dehydrogenase YdfG